MEYNIREYGAVGDGETNDTMAIQAAIDECAANGGGRVLIPGGRTYRSGMISLRSHVELHLEAGAVLKGSDHMEDYDPQHQWKPGGDHLEVPSYENCEYTGAPFLFFLHAKDCEDLSITGEGTIDGNEKIFYGNASKWHIDGSFYPRVPLIYLENVRHLSILHVTLRGSAFWTTHLSGCSDVLIDGIHILNNLRMANCDGIDPDHCQNVRIVNCHIETADDCIVFKNTRCGMDYGPCENIVVSNCTLISTSAAIKFGTESEALFKNILIQNCTISRSNRGISLQLRDQGSIENVIFSNITIETRHFSKDQWWGAAEPIAITAVRRKKNSPVGSIRNIRFRDILCTAENGILIYGDPGVNIENITFEDVSVTLRRESRWPGGRYDLRPTEEEGAITEGTWGIYMRNARDVSFRNLQINVSEEMKEEISGEENVRDCEQIFVNGKEICRN